jgi:hypothetical protein
MQQAEAPRNGQHSTNAEVHTNASQLQLSIQHCNSFTEQAHLQRQFDNQVLGEESDTVRQEAFDIPSGVYAGPQYQNQGLVESILSVILPEAQAVISRLDENQQMMNKRVDMLEELVDKIDLMLSNSPQASTTRPMQQNNSHTDV